MAQLHSYLDTTLRIIHINRASGLPADVTENMRQEMKDAETSAPIRREFIKRHLEIEHRSNPELLRVLSHEFHHYLQGLFYPFLYYLSWLELDNLIYLGGNLKSSAEESFEIDEIHMSPEFFRNFNFLYQNVEFYIENDNLKIRVPLNASWESNVFTLNDLLEDATTIFEYRINNDLPTADGFDKWINNPSNNCYKKTYRFLKSLWGNEDAFILLPLIVQVAFTCTDPLSGFCGVVSYINFYTVDYKNKTQNELFVELISFLESKLGNIVLDPDTHHFITEIPVSIIRFKDLDKVIAKAGGGNTGIHYPLNIHMEKLVNKINDDPAYQSKILNIDKSSFDEILTDFYPFAIHYHYRDFDGRNGTIVMNTEFRDSKSPNGLDYPFYVKELIKIKETHLALFSRIHNYVEHNCHHQKCGYFKLDLCKLWNSIPYDYTKCGFPQWFAYLFHREIDITDRKLIKISKEQANKKYDEYWRRSFKSRTFEYKPLNPGYVLTIDAQDIGDERAKNILPDFLNHLKMKHQETIETLFSSVIIDFFGYDHDPRPVFQIPEIVSFINESKKLVPELLFYIDFNSEIDHKFMLLPMFIEHEAISDGGDYQIFANPSQHAAFVLNESEIWLEFLNKNQLPLKESYLNNLKKMFS